MKMIDKIHYVFLVGFFATDAFSQSADQPVTPELVGKWCYVNLISNSDIITNSCITLNSDGTFEVVVDPGTLPRGTNLATLQTNDYGKWYVKNNRLYYNSNSNGQGSFQLQKTNHPRLENTPMIVLNGVAFAASSPRDPW
jgi:hypothetical protein